MKKNKIVLRAENLEKTFPLDRKEVPILKDITMQVAEGEFAVLSGSSGSGKSTLLSILAGLDRPTSGKVILGETEISGLTENELAPVRNRETGFVFQSFHLIPSLTALENVMFPAELAGDNHAREKAEALLTRCGLSHRFMNFPSQMSGGEQQRCAICRAIINEPRLIYADEPTGNLDSRNSDAIIELLTELHHERNTSLVIATHSSQLAAKADHVFQLHDGRLLEGSSS